MRALLEIIKGILGVFIIGTVLFYVAMFILMIIVFNGGHLTI